jgi:hypothetical protein
MVKTPRQAPSLDESCFSGVRGIRPPCETRGALALLGTVGRLGSSPPIAGSRIAGMAFLFLLWPLFLTLGGCLLGPLVGLAAPWWTWAILGSLFGVAWLIHEVGFHVGEAIGECRSELKSLRREVREVMPKKDEDEEDIEDE